MRKQLVALVIGVLVGGSVPVVQAMASTPKPSGYCSIKERGKVATYTTPSKSATYKVKCTVVQSQKWKRVK